MSTQKSHTNTAFTETTTVTIQPNLDAAAAKAAGRDKGLNGCTTVVVVGPDFDIKGYRCGGSCGWFDRLLGRTCKTVERGNSSGGVDVACTCTGGWWDTIFA
ncbi:MAG: hypothetical protein QNJ22_12020 [Desulfosarcinaceae bacterium]|nr:hypothetical protein [Desulfosarcinaceae bacterium]